MPPTYYIAIACIDTLWVSWALLWFILAFRTKRTIYRQPWRQRLAYVALGIPYVLITPYIPRYWLIYPNPPMEAAGIALCAAGLAFAVWARLILGRNWSGFITLKQDHQLIQSGPYRFVRHPIYTGVLAAILGTAIALFPSLHGILLVTFLTTAFIIKLRQEEKLMLQQFPEAYPAYKSRVRAALVPFLF